MVFLRDKNSVSLLLLTALLGSGSFFAVGCTGDDTKDPDDGLGGAGGGDGDGDSGGDGDGDGGDGGDGDEPIKSSCTNTDAVELTDEDLEGDVQLKSGGCFKLTRSLSLSGRGFTVGSGTTILMTKGIGIDVNQGGSLRIRGTPSRPVRFGAEENVGTWKGIRVEAGVEANNEWENLEITDAGDAQWTGATHTKSSIYLSGNAAVKMVGVTVRNSRGHGILIDEGVSLQFENGTFEGNNIPARVHPSTAHALGPETRFIDNENNYVSVSAGSQTGSTTWSALEVPFRIEGGLNVEGDLSLEPGAELEVTQNTSIQVSVGGTLTALGTEEEPIVFRGVNASRGFWRGIDVQSAGSSAVSDGFICEYCEFSNTGSSRFTGRADTISALYMGTTSSASITHSTFSKNEMFAVWASEEARFSEFSDNTFRDNARVMLLHPNRVRELSATQTIEDNDFNVIEVTMGSDTISTGATWRDLGVPYRLLNNLTVDAAWDIAPGVIIEGDENVGITVVSNGSLTTLGEAENLVVFRGRNAVPDGYWQGIRFESNTLDNALNYTQLLHAGMPRWTGAETSDAAIFLPSPGRVILNNVTIGPGGGHGVTLAGGTVTCTATTFVDLVKGAVYDGSDVVEDCP